MNRSRRVTRYLALITLSLTLVSFACFALPMYVIRPFRPQGATELRVALFVNQIGPSLSIVCSVLALFIVVAGWRQIRGRIPRSIVVFCLLLAAASCFLARFNVFEVMFHPLGVPQFQSVEQAHLDKDDMLIALRLNGASRAYPIREIAYHHIVNDTLGGEPIVATY
jgi:uncharacterized membrane protein YozB (DUF420 family)